MREQGLVIEAKANRTALVRLNATAACAKCGACMLRGSGAAEIEAQNDLGAKAGDIVEVAIEPQRVIWASFVVFISPLIALIVGYLLGSSLAVKLGSGAEQNYGIISAFLMLVFSLLGLNLYDRRLRKDEKFMCRIVKIVSAK